MNEEPFTSSGISTTEAHPGAPHESGSPLQQKTGQTAESFKSEAEKLKGAAREHGTAAMDQMKEGFQSATHQAQEAGRTFIRNQQEMLASRLSEYAEAARAASERLHGEEGNMLARPAERAADGLERLSHYLKEKQPADLMGDLENFARRRPEVVFGGLFIAGLAAARFLKASSRGVHEYRSSQAIVPTSGPDAPEPVHFGPTSGVGSSGGRSAVSGTPSTSVGATPTTSPSTSSIPPATGVSTSPTIPPVPSESTPFGTTPGGTSTFPNNPNLPGSTP